MFSYYYLGTNEQINTEQPRITDRQTTHMSSDCKLFRKIYFK
jgi:hypothetical protein